MNVVFEWLPLLYWRRRGQIKLFLNYEEEPFRFTPRASSPNRPSLDKGLSPADGGLVTRSNVAAAQKNSGSSSEVVSGFPAFAHTGRWKCKMRNWDTFLGAETDPRTRDWPTRNWERSRRKDGGDGGGGGGGGNGVHRGGTEETSPVRRR